MKIFLTVLCAFYNLFYRPTASFDKGAWHESNADNQVVDGFGERPLPVRKL